MKQLLLLIMTVVLVGCGKKEEGKPQSNAKTPSPTTSTKSDPQTEPTDTDTDTDTDADAEKEKPLSESTKLLIAQAEKGDADAAEKLGDMYYVGFGGVSKDGKEAVNWYRKAAEQGNAYAQQVLAGFYYTGDIVEQDQVTAWAWANILFENGNPVAELLKASYRDGRGKGYKPMTPEDFSKAQELSKEMIKNNPKLIRK